MTPAAFAIPGNVDLPTGGYGYDRRLLALLGRFGVVVRHVALPGSYPEPTPDDLATSLHTLKEAARAQPHPVLVIDGLAYGAMPLTLIDALPGPVLALVHHPLCLEAGLSEARRTALRALETAALARAAHVVATSPTTAATLTAGFGVPPARITVAPPGTDPAPRATGTPPGGAPLQLLAVGSVVPRKAYPTLVRALAPLRRRAWRLIIVGPTGLDPGALAALQAAIRETGLEERIALAGPASPGDIARLYAAADLMVSASLYEGYGMALAEALARGLPIVATTGGAAAETVPDAAAIKVAPGDEAALTAAIARVLDDGGLRRRLGDAAWAAARALPRWEDTARIVAGAIRATARGAAPREGVA
jgi:glycosyltransferase involved in cell wall biosynthesis